MLDAWDGRSSLVTFIPAGQVGGNLITVGEARSICIERVLGAGAGDTWSLFSNAAGELLWSHPMLTSGQVLRDVPEANIDTYEKESARIGLSLASALINGRLASYVQRPASGTLLRIRSTYWFPANKPITGDSYLVDCAGAAGFDPSMIDQPVFLDRQAVTAWAAKSLFPLAVKEEGPTPEARKRGGSMPKRGGGRPKPDWYQHLHRMMSEHNARRNAATAGGRQPPAWPVTRAFLSKVLGAYSGTKPPTYSAVVKHVEKIKLELLG